MKKLLLLITGLVCFSIGTAFASAPSSYDFSVKSSDDHVWNQLPVADTISFDYWYDMTGELGSEFSAVLIGNRAGGEYNGKYYDDPTTIATINFSGPMNSWTTFSYEVPFYDIVFPNGNQRTDPLQLDMVLNTFNPDCTLYIRNLRSYDTGRDIGYPRNSAQPVPEPGTFAMMGTALLGFVGLKFRNRRRS